MRFCIFSSGSKQNCFYIESDDAAFLIDMGLSYRRLRAMLAEIGREIGDIRGIFISHEHSDHTRGLQTLVKHIDIPIYLHPDSYRRLGLAIPQAVELSGHAPISLGGLTIHPFPVRHDAVNTFGFRITHGTRSLFLASDIGSFDQETLELCQRCHAIGIESNYDPEELRRCSYPPYLKSRIRSDSGHLSNDDAVRFLMQAISGDTHAAFMLHLSINSNSHALVQRQIDNHLADAFTHVKFHISHREQALPIVEV